MKKFQIIALMFISSSLVIAADSYRVNAGQLSYVNEHAVCKKINNTGTKDVHLSTKTSGEWSSFYNNLPPLVTATSAMCCGGAGSDDAACGTIDCDALDTYFTTAVYNDATSAKTCYRKDYADLTSARCKASELCKSANSADCSSSADVLQYTCTQCQNIIGCSGATLGNCQNMLAWASGAAGVYCGAGQKCDGAGNCVSAGSDARYRYSSTRSYESGNLGYAKCTCDTAGSVRNCPTTSDWYGADVGAGCYDMGTGTNDDYDIHIRQ